MNPARTAKLLSRYSSGLLTAAEVANATLMDLVADVDASIEVRPVVAELPGEVRDELLDLLRNIRGAGYRWKPFRLGPAGDGPAADPDPANLRRVCEELGVV